MLLIKSDFILKTLLLDTDSVKTTPNEEVNQVNQVNQVFPREPKLIISGGIKFKCFAQTLFTRE